MKWENIVNCVDIKTEAVKPFNGTKMFLSTGALDGNTVIMSELVQVTYDNRPSRANLVVHEGDIIFAKMQNTKKVLQITKENENLIVSTGFFVVRPKNSLNGEYLFEYLNSELFNSQKDKFCTGATQKALTNAGLKEIFIPLPDIETQKKIAGALKRIRLLTEKRKEQIAVLDKLGKDTFIDMFGDPKDNPMCWDKKLLGETIKDICYGSSIKAFDISDENSIPILRIPNIVGGVINTTDIKYVDRSLVSRKLLLKNGDILFVRTNGNPDYIARCAVFKMDGDFVFASYLIRARVDMDIVNPEFIVFALSMDSIREEIRKECRTTAGNYNINTNGIKSLSLILPPIDLQQQFAERIAVIERQKERLKESLVELETLYKVTMKKAFAGELFS